MPNSDGESSGSVGADAFRDAMAPTVAALREFSNAVDQVPDRYGGEPSAESRAMSEISAGQGYATRSSRLLPITETHGFGALTLRAASDCVRTFAEAFTAERMPVWGHLVVARSALEASVVAWWLSEPAIDPLERIKRGLCEQLYSADEVRKLDIRENAAQDVDQLKADAAGFGWQVRFDRGRPVVDGAKRPSVPDGIRTLLERDEGATIGACSGAGCRRFHTSLGSGSAGRSACPTPPLAASWPVALGSRPSPLLPISQRSARRHYASSGRYETQQLRASS
jgi:hypothetical protein